MSDSHSNDSPLRLYSVTLETEVVVLATSTDDAEDIARRRRGDEDSWDVRAKPMTSLPAEWDMDSCPYSDGPPKSLDTLIAHGFAPGFKPAA